MANNYDKLVKVLHNLNNSVDDIQSLIANEFINHIKEKYPEDLKKIQGLFEKFITKITAVEYIAENDAWCKTVVIETKSEKKEFVVSTGNGWYEDLDSSDFIYNIYINNIRASYAKEKEILLILKRFYDEYPYVNNEYVS